MIYINIDSSNTLILAPQLKLESIQYIQISMQEAKPEKEALRPLNCHYELTLSKSIRSWSDFTTTFLPISFQQSLNQATPQQIESFWNDTLQQLCNQEDKVCILVPAELTKNDANDVLQSGKKDVPIEKGNGKLHNKQKSKGKQPPPSSKVPINKQVIETAVELVSASYPSLSFDYASLFLGNQKQLLIFRKCYAIESYIQKYRLPNNFKEPLQTLIDLTDQFHHLKIQRNKAVSSFHSQDAARLTNKLGKLNKQIAKQLGTFSVQWREILCDFNSKQKCRDLMLKNISAELIAILRPICQQLQTQIIDRYYQCQCDQYKDILVVKKNDARLLPISQRIYDQPPQQPTRYVYVQPEKSPQPPKDIRNLEFLGVELEKRCFKYRVELSQAEQWDKCEGIFIRSEEGEPNYELTIDISEACRSVDFDVYPYSAGKVSYQIYLWNSAGFTKSTEKIVLFNELQPPNAKRSLTINKNVHFLGQSQYGIKYIHDNEEDGEVAELVQFHYTAKQLSIKNSAVICDQLGDAAAWGLLYYSPQNNQENDQQEEDGKRKQFRIEAPSLILRNKNVRKVSCGNGYCLMLTIFGSIYSMGTNQYGQLGLGDFSEGHINTEPRQICKFTNEQNGFVIDIKATSAGASFAINHRGELYRWGFNQVTETDHPIVDRFGSTINYRAMPVAYKQPHPTKITKIYIPEAVKKVQDGEYACFALTGSGSLYGWGMSKFLGIHQLLDKDQNLVTDIVNPILIIKNIAQISANFEHAIVITTDNRILAWGNSSCFSNSQQKFYMTPTDISSYIGNPSEIKRIKAGRNFTAMVTHQNRLIIVGKDVNFSQKEYDLNMDVCDIVCGDEELIAILANP